MEEAETNPSHPEEQGSLCPVGGLSLLRARPASDPQAPVGQPRPPPAPEQVLGG